MRAARWAASGRRLARDRSGVAAVEFAMLSSVLVLASVLMLDFAHAFHMQLQLTNGVTAASQYAFQKGQNIAPRDVPDFLAKVASIVAGTSRLSAAPKVTVTYNGAADGSRANGFYCVSGPPWVWAQTGAAASACGGGISSGRFVTITVTAKEAALFKNNPVLGGVIPLADRSIVRLK